MNVLTLMAIIIACYWIIGMTIISKIHDWD
jgi:hypothetical protein